MMDIFQHPIAVYLVLRTINIQVQYNKEVCKIYHVCNCVTEFPQETSGQVLFIYIVPHVSIDI